MNIEKAIKFYYDFAKLKETLRSGPVQWQVESEIKETIASHVYGTLSLAIALHSELKLDVDLYKVLLMLAIHETEEVVIGDITPLDAGGKMGKQKSADEAVRAIFGGLSGGEKYVELIEEFNLGETKEAHFAKACDKLECVLQFKKYCDEGKTGIEKMTPEMSTNAKVNDLKKRGYALDDIFYLYHMEDFKDLGFTKKLWFDCIKKIKI